MKANGSKICKRQALPEAPLEAEAERINAAAIEPLLGEGMRYVTGDDMHNFHRETIADWPKLIADFKKTVAGPVKSTAVEQLAT